MLFVGFFLATRAHGENPTVPDVQRYHDYGHAVAAGFVPYRDFRLEYPPAALGVFVLPAFGTSGATWTPRLNAAARRYSNAFAALMILLGAVAIVLTALSLRVLRASTRDVLLALGVLSAAPLLLGGVVYTRYDFWPAALTAAAIAAALVGRMRLGSIALGVAAAAKLYPLALLPLFVARAWKRRDRREALTCLGLTLGAAATIFVPFLALAPGPTASAVREQIGRGLQVESLGSAILATLHLVAHIHLYVRQAGNGLSADELHGSGTTAALVSGSVVLAVFLATLWIRFARSSADDRLFAQYCAAAVVGLLAFGHVLSPQLLIWLLPVVPLVGGRRGVAALVLLTVSLLATHVWFSRYYVAFVERLSTGSTLLLLTRDALLVILVATLVWPASGAQKATAGEAKAWTTAVVQPVGWLGQPDADVGGEDL